ncbi:MAG: hypothetical protein JXB48_23725 [Candidatus Latescibacteria bacterium]|nr:hypothetical protein [Candidatus Latescibacterota bacterium]
MANQKKEVVYIILGNKPVAYADKEMEFILYRYAFSFAKPGYQFRLLSVGRAPYVCFLSVRV